MTRFDVYMLRFNKSEFNENVFPPIRASLFFLLLFFSLLLLEKIRSSFIMLRIKETNSFRLLANREFWITSGFELHSFFFIFFLSHILHPSCVLGLQVLRIMRLGCKSCVSYVWVVTFVYLPYLRQVHDNLNWVLVAYFTSELRLDFKFCISLSKTHQDF